MPILGLLLGRRLSGALGSHADLIGGALLVATGAVTAGLALRTTDAPPSRLDPGTGRLLLLAAGLSIDNLIVGFALGAYDVPLGLAVTVIAAVSVALSVIGLELGEQLGSKVEQHSELLGGIVLMCVGAAIAAGLV